MYAVRTPLQGQACF